MTGNFSSVDYYRKIYIFNRSHSSNSIEGGCKGPSPGLERPVQRLSH